MHDEITGVRFTCSYSRRSGRDSGCPERSPAFTRRKLNSTEQGYLRAACLSEAQMDAIAMVGLGTDELQGLLLRGIDQVAGGQVTNRIARGPGILLRPRGERAVQHPRMETVGKASEKHFGWTDYRLGSCHGPRGTGRARRV